MNENKSIPSIAVSHGANVASVFFLTAIFYAHFMYVVHAPNILGESSLHDWIQHAFESLGFYLFYSSLIYPALIFISLVFSAAVLFLCKTKKHFVITYLTISGLLAGLTIFAIFCGARNPLLLFCWTLIFLPFLSKNLRKNIL